MSNEYSSGKKNHSFSWEKEACLQEIGANVDISIGGHH
jgi:hypothetical protein